MKTHLKTILMILAVTPLGLTGVALAHGEPVITVEPSIVAVGGTITVMGSEMEPDEVFTITLEGLSGSTLLGEAAASGEGEEGSFIAIFTIPPDTAPGSYTVRVVAGEGESAVADLTITTPSEETDAGPIAVDEATREQHQLDRSKPLGQVIGVIAIALLSGALGLWLIQQPG